jgi:hypothetical protein
MPGPGKCRRGAAGLVVNAECALGARRGDRDGADIDGLDARQCLAINALFDENAKRMPGWSSYAAAQRALRPELDRPPLDSQ